MYKKKADAFSDFIFLVEALDNKNFI